MNFYKHKDNMKLFWSAIIVYMCN